MSENSYNKESDHQLEESKTDQLEENKLSNEKTTPSKLKLSFQEK